MKKPWLGALIPLLLLITWELIWWIPGERLESLSHPVAVASALVSGLAGGSILTASRETLEAAILGFLLACAIGIPSGIVLGLLPRVNRVVGPTIDALRPVPSVALIPLALMLFGFGVLMEASVVSFACLWPILLITASSVKGLEPRWLEVARLLDFSVLERTFKIVLPGAIGGILVGLRLALGISLIVAVTVEIVLNPRGLGHAMMAAQQALQFDLMYANLLWVGVLGWSLNTLTYRVLMRLPVARVSLEGVSA